jgi:DNA invertase Pin-like site-specific DNA recombinase
MTPTSTEPGMTPAITYGVKSSKDEESAEDQLKTIRERIDDPDRIVGEFHESGQSGYRKERGPQLEAAMRAAIEAAPSELWVWHSSRLARGDGTKGKRSISKVVNDLLYENVVVRSATDDEMVKQEFVGIASKSSNKYSADLSTWTKAGLARRKAAGKAVGPIPFGYAVEKQIVDDNVVVVRRVIDPVTGPALKWIFEQTARGTSPGDIARSLNAQGTFTARGNGWRARAIHDVIDLDVYTGQRGYPAIITSELARAAAQCRQRLDPAAVQSRK